MTRRPRDIGTDAERGVARWLQANGWPNAERRALRGNQDAGDITGTPGICWSVKGGATAKRAGDATVARWLAELDRQRGNARADLGVLVMQRTGYSPARAGQWWAVTRLWTITYLQLVSDRDERGMPGYTGGAVLYAVAATDPATPWMLAPARMQLADLAQLLRAAGYGTPLDEETH